LVFLISPLIQPKTWVEFALVWRPQNVSRVAEEFRALASKHFPPPADSKLAPI